MEKTRQNFKVTGMHCAGCVARVEKTLNNQPGIVNASVNLANEIAQVEFQNSSLSSEELNVILQEIGFGIETVGSSSEEENHEKSNKTRNLAILSLIFSVPLMVIGMGFPEIPFANEIMWLLATPVVVYAGREFYVNSWKQLRHKTVSMDTLVALSTGVAYLYSAFATAFPEWWTSRGLNPHVYFEAATVIIGFILLGRWLEKRARQGTRSAIKKLIGLQPREVNVIRDGNDLTIPVEEVTPGDHVIVKPGQRVPVDGRILRGSTFIDEGMMTGEPFPVEKQKGDSLMAGTINQQGSVVMITEKSGNDTVLAQIVQSVEDAQGSKAKIQKLADNIASVFVPVVITIASVAMIGWWIFGGEQAFGQGIIAFVTTLVIACPCALGLATPTAIMVGIGKAANLGILIREADSLEKAGKIDTIILDKTGTLTTGKPFIVSEKWLVDNPLFPSIVKSMENQSEHPLSYAFTQHFKDHNLIDLEEFQVIPGKGISAQVDGKTFYLGNMSYAEEITQVRTESNPESETLVYFFSNTQILAQFRLGDKLKDEAANVVQAFGRRGIDVVMATGDRKESAIKMASELGIDKVHFEMSPLDKGNLAKSLQKEGKKVAMVGDGINDSTALATADLSIAMGNGNDISMEVADMTILSSRLDRILVALKSAELTSKTIRQNLFWAFIYNIIGIPVAAGILYPFTGFLLNPMIAGAAMAFSSVSVVLNSLRLNRKKIHLD